MRSLTNTALCLALASNVDARVPVEASSRGSFKWLRDLFPKRQAVCYPDQYTNLVNNSTEGETFCQSFMDYPTQTVYVDFTPLSTISTIASTTTLTATDNVLLTPMVTVTVTEGAAPSAIAKRDAEGMRALPGATRNQLYQRFRQRIAAADNGTIDDATVSASFSSACGCANYGGPTTTVTLTQPTSTVTIRGIDRQVVTTTITRAAAAFTTTATVPLSSAASSSPASAVPDTTLSSVSAPTPTALALSCPQDDNTEVSQMVGNARYDYLINCASDIDGATIFSASYGSFAECAGACSSVDTTFSSPVCQGVSYANEVDADGNNCFVKSNATAIVSSSGAQVARLQRIARGLSNTTADGTTTDVVFTPPATSVSSVMNSMVSSVLANSTTSLPLITPGPVTTFYSTDLQVGSTFSAGSGFTTAFTSSGIWYLSYATSWTLEWSSAATIYQSVSGSSSGGVSSSNQTSVTEQTGANGEITVITNNTEVNYYPNNSAVTTEYLTTVTYNSARSTLGSTTTTIFIGGAGGSGGGIASGIIATPTPSTSLYTSFFNTSSVYSTEGSVSTSYYATQSVYTIVIGGNGTGNAGGAASGALSTIAPSTSATTIVEATGTTFSSGTLISGVISSVEVVATPQPSTTVFVNGTAYTTGTLISGIINGTAGASSNIISGTIPGFSDTGAPRGPGSESTATATGTAPVLTGTTASSLVSFIESSIISGVIPTGVVPTGAIPSGSFNVTVSVSIPSSPANATSIAIIPPFPSSSLTGYFPSSSSGFPPFGDTGLPRGPGSETGGTSGIVSGTISGVAPSGTAPGSSGYLPLTGSGLPRPSGTAPLVPIGAIPSGFPASSGVPPFNASGLPRGSEGLSTSTPVGTAPIAGPTFNTTSPSTACSTETAYLGTTTVFVTTTEYGCAETCTPLAGYFPGPQSFGPPQFRQTATAE